LSAEGIKTPPWPATPATRHIHEANCSLAQIGQNRNRDAAAVTIACKNRHRYRTILKRKICDIRLAASDAENKNSQIPHE
jgi:hypothetical protein